MQLSLRRFWIASSSFWTMSYNNTAAKTVSALVAPATSLDLAGSKGEFTRSDALWRNWIKAGECECVSV